MEEEKQPKEIKETEFMSIEKIERLANEGLTKHLKDEREKLQKSSGKQVTFEQAEKARIELFGEDYENDINDTEQKSDKHNVGFGDSVVRSGGSTPDK